MRRAIEYFVMDVDGTLTDGKIYVGSNGEVFKAFDVKDGYAIREVLSSLGIVPVVITGRRSAIVEERCRELGIQHVFQGATDKLSVLNHFIDEQNSALNRVAYIGDDLNDLEVMLAVKAAEGIVASPADAAKQILNMSDYVSSQAGGNGAVRDFIDWIMQHHRAPQKA